MSDFSPAEILVSQVIGYIKGKTQFHLAQIYGEREERRFCRSALLGARIFSCLGGLPPTKKLPGQYIKNQEAKNKRLDRD